MASERWAIGTMTGTSLDGLDVALVRATGRGLELEARVESHGAHELGELGERLRAYAAQEPASARDTARMARAFGELHARAIEALDPARTVELVAVHGQTVVHDADVSWALVDPAPLVARLDCAVVTDLRLVDRAAGGEGAPITPLADWVLLRRTTPRTVVNLGGFANVTHLPGEGDDVESVHGGDVCPCNQLLDAASRRHLGEPFDADGSHASRGRADRARARRIEEQLTRAAEAPRSLGTGDEGLASLEHVADLGPCDALATLASAVSRRIATGCGDAHEVLLFGGGVHNRALVEGLRAALPERRVQVGSRSCTPEAREAAAMAVLGLLARDGTPITLPAVTGRSTTRHLDGRWILPR